MSMRGDNHVGLKWHGGFYTDVIFQGHQQWMDKRIVGLCIPRIERVRVLWHRLFFKFWVYSYVLVSKNKILSDSIHQIETHLDVVVEVIEVQSRVTFEFCLDEEFKEFWWSDIMFEIIHATNYCRMSTFQWWSLIISCNHIVRILGLWWVYLLWKACFILKQ